MMSLPQHSTACQHGTARHSTAFHNSTARHMMAADHNAHITAHLNISTYEQHHPAQEDNYIVIITRPNNKTQH
jgi:hypothetical protein